MTEDVKEKLQKAEEAAARMDTLRSDASFRDSHDEQMSRLQQAIVEGLEALYHQNQAIIELLKGRGTR